MLSQSSSNIGGHSCPSAFLLAGLRANKTTEGPVPFTKHWFLLKMHFLPGARVNRGEQPPKGGGV